MDFEGKFCRCSNAIRVATPLDSVRQQLIAAQAYLTRPARI